MLGRWTSFRGPGPFFRGYVRALGRGPTTCRRIPYICTKKTVIVKGKIGLGWCKYLPDISVKCFNPRMAVLEGKRAYGIWNIKCQCSIQKSCYRRWGVGCIRPKGRSEGCLRNPQKGTVFYLPVRGTGLTHTQNIRENGTKINYKQIENK